MLDAHKNAMVERLRTDAEYRRAFARNCIALPEWRRLFDGLSSSVLASMFGDVMSELSLEQLGYLIKKQAASIGRGGGFTGNRAGSKPRPETVHVWVIYWLFMESAPDVPIYVGQTRQLSERWTAHRNGSSETSSIEDRSELRIRVVETICGNERDALIAERRHIIAARMLNPKLLNKA